MLEIKGTYQTAYSMAENLDAETIKQIEAICSCEAYKNAKIRVMADAHAGKGSTVGTTIKLNKDSNDDYCAIPNTIGVDIGCGVAAAKLGVLPENFDFEILDKIIRTKVPSGDSIHNVDPELNEKHLIWLAKRVKDVSKNIEKSNMYSYYMRSLGTLGGGNHFISLEQRKDGYTYLIVHTGSRRFGYDIATYWQNIAKEFCDWKYKTERLHILRDIEPSKRQAFIEKNNAQKIPEGQEYVIGYSFSQYFDYVRTAQDYAQLNRQLIIKAICDELKTVYGIEQHGPIIESVHNYIDTEKMIIRKGAISAKKNEICIIPLNMRDGSLICEGLGKEEWNYSAPHGAGRVGSRAAARASITLEEYKQSMEGIWSSCINKNTIDEAPMAYKNADAIKSAIGCTVNILEELKPIYNFKAN